MNLRDLKNELIRHREKNLRFVLPDGDPIPAEFHVTEVSHVTRKSIDCGGTTRQTAACVLQIWVAENNKEHRLTAEKLSSILELARSVVPSDDLDVEVEYEGCVISQYPVMAVRGGDPELTFTLGAKHTDCLAKEACGLEPSGCGCDSTEGKCC